MKYLDEAGNKFEYWEKQLFTLDGSDKSASAEIEFFAYQQISRIEIITSQNLVNTPVRAVISLIQENLDQDGISSSISVVNLNSGDVGQ